MFDYDLLLVNPPMLIIEPDYITIGTPAKFSMKAMNPGVLSVASYLDYKGFQVKIIDLFEENSLEKLIKELRTEKPKVVGISVMSGFSYLESLECVRIAKQESEDSLCVVGGQHVAPIGPTVLQDCKSLDIVVKCEGECLMEQIVSKHSDVNYLKRLPGIAYRNDRSTYESKIPPPVIDINDLPPMKFELYPSYADFIPFIEESRGCPYSCLFCVNSGSCKHRFQVKNPKHFASELEHTVSLFGEEPIYAVLASSFGLDSKSTLALASSLRRHGVRWITQLRVDSPSIKHLPKLCGSGLRIISVGVESGSSQILRLMQKTREPYKWVRMTEKLVQEVSHIEELKMRMNIVFFVGETPQTLRETLKLIVRNSYGIDMVGAMTVFAIPGSRLTSDIDYFSKRFGSSLLRTKYSDATHLFPCVPSQYFSFEQAAHFCDTLEKLFVSPEDYEASRTGDYKKFQKLVAEVPSNG